MVNAHTAVKAITSASSGNASKGQLETVTNMIHWEIAYHARTTTSSTIHSHNVFKSLTNNSVHKTRPESTIYPQVEHASEWM